MFNKKIKRFTVSVGLNDKDTKRQELTEEQALSIIAQAMEENDLDGNIQRSLGVYTHEDGTKVKENSFNIEMMFVKEDNVLKMIQELSIKLNQESIVLKKDKVNSKLIFGRV